MLKEFKDFALRGNVIDLAVGVIIGGAFGKIVSSMVNDILMPPLGLLIGDADFSELALTLRAAGASGKPITVNYGVFGNHVIDFIIQAFCIFLVVKAMNSLVRKAPAPTPAPTEKACPQCCMLIPIQAKRCGHCTATLA